MSPKLYLATPVTGRMVNGLPADGILGYAILDPHQFMLSRLWESS